MARGSKKKKRKSGNPGRAWSNKLRYTTTQTIEAPSSDIQHTLSHWTAGTPKSIWLEIAALGVGNTRAHPVQRYAYASQERHQGLEGFAFI